MEPISFSSTPGRETGFEIRQGHSVINIDNHLTPKEKKALVRGIANMLSYIATASEE
jgi:hypothetical protein